MKKQTTPLDKFSKILLGIAVIGIIFLAIYNIVRKDSKEQLSLQLKEYDYTADTIPFEVDSVLSMYEENDSLRMVIQYLYNDSVYSLYTSTLEGMYLNVYIETLYYYKDALIAQQPDLISKAREEIDNLQSYISSNSHIEYVDNEYFTGFTWTYDACPIYRLRYVGQ